jgi:hypothetical protein
LFAISSCGHGNSSLVLQAVQLGAAETVAALTSGLPTLTSGTAQLPFSAELLESGKVHEVINSNDILGGHGTFTTLSATAKFHAERRNYMKQ